MGRADLLKMKLKDSKRSLQEQKEENLRKRLNYTTHKLEQLEAEFDSTRQYLETELRRAQEELDKFMDKLHRVQSSYAALQRINQDLEDKIHHTKQHHEEEKGALSHEIIVLNNHLMEAKITIKKLREDNEVYRKDCNLAAQLLQCGKTHYQSHKVLELPIDFQDRLSSHMEKHCGHSRAVAALCHSPYSDTSSVPASVIGKVLEKPEPGRISPRTRSPSPQHPDVDVFRSSMDRSGIGIGEGSTITGGLRGGQGRAGRGGGGGEQLQQRHKMPDLYSSDTALYCPLEDRRRERWQERRQSMDMQGNEAGGLQLLHAQNSTDSNPDDDGSLSSSGVVEVGADGFLSSASSASGVFGSHRHHSSHPSFHKFTPAGSLPMSSSYSGFSATSDEKAGCGLGLGLGGALSSSQQLLHRDWREAGSTDYQRKTSASSYERGSGLGFQKSRSFQHMGQLTGSPQNNRGGVQISSAAAPPSYRRTPSCFSEPYHSPHLPPRNNAVFSSSDALRPDSRESYGSSSSSRVGVGVRACEEDLSRRWRQLSVEELNAISYRGQSGRVSPFSFSECHFATTSPTKTKLGPLYNSLQKGDDSVFLGRTVEPFSYTAGVTAAAPTSASSPRPSPGPKLPPRRQEKRSLYRASKDDSQEELEVSVLHSASSKNNRDRSMKKECVDVDASPNSSAEPSLHQSPRNTSASSSTLHHYKRPLLPPPLPPQRKTPRQYQKFGTTGLSRKDSLTKAQLYGTLMN
ncbi:brain-enriched guanylate kinase-associated protein [Engraulis encrasicolus]|uniref:brain-enriched guanylate kinase-associated protein n=1 Tax=Engraulis encrasicolus TaxID=184585 RepID=UPI002FD55ABD